MNVIVSKLREVSLSVFPISVLVLILHFTISPINTTFIIRFLLGSIFVVLGLTIFLLGVDIGITPLGYLTGVSLAKSNKLWVVLIGGLLLGFSISIAEPGLMVLANQVEVVTSGQIQSISLLVIVSIGLAVLLVLGFLRIFYNIPLYKLLIVLYFIILGLSIFTSKEFLAISFDASGSTTGILAVPFILSLSVGIAKLKKDSKASEKDSFGLIAIASTGANISVMILDICSKTKQFSVVQDPSIDKSTSIISPFIKLIPENLKESFISIMPLLAILLVLQKIFFRLTKREFRKLLTGFVFAFTGLFLFLNGVYAGFIDIGTSIGQSLILLDSKAYILITGFILGVVTILAEPAVHVLTQQIEDVTSGYVKKNVVLIPLAIGVGLAVALSIIRVLVSEIHLWHYLLPGYLICIILMFFIPKLFVGIAFDAGGVATGPMTVTFILSFIQGAANALEEADLMADGFGMIAMVAMIPIITLETLGLIFSLKLKMRGDEKKSG
ncbi:MAG: DUF1538 domain-containing protein [Oscillospiraceae bacterium]